MRRLNSFQKAYVVLARENRKASFRGRLHGPGERAYLTILY